MATLSLSDSPGRSRPVVIGIERLREQAIRPHGEGGRLGVERRALSLDQQSGRQRKRVFFHRKFKATNTPPAAHPSERPHFGQLRHNSTVAAPRRRGPPSF